MWELYYQGEKWLTLHEMNSFISRFRGYMARNLEDVEEGLWFPDCTTLHTFFMRFNLDIYFLDGDHKIVAVNSNVTSGRFVSKWGADSALEIPAGSRPLVKVGETLEFVPCP